jgi:hypothetical protein
MFKLFLEYFPVADELPLTVVPDDIRDYEQNHVLPLDLIQQYIAPYDRTNSDGDLIEFVPCFQLPATGFHTLVWWRGDLLDHAFELVTYTPAGVQIARRTIAGLTADGDRIREQIATIEDATTVLSVSGIADSTGQLIDAAGTDKMISVIDENGKIL